MSNIEGITSKNPFGNNDTIAKVNITQNGYLPIATFPNSGQYILSAYIKADKSAEIRFLMNETSEIQRMSVSNSWKELEIPITANTNDELILRLPTNTYYLYNWKIEEGNKATTYTVAPEDTDEQIDELNVQYSEVIQTINSISATVGKHTTEISNKADNSTVTEVKNQVSQLTLDLDGFRTEVSDTYTTKTESQQIQSNIDSVSDNLASFSNSISKEIEDLQNQLDGSITTWFYEGEPTLNNEPAVNWTTTEEKNNHIGDIYYDTITGYSYRFQIMNNQYVWHLLADSDVTKALEMASKAQDTADSKRRVFVDTPYPPYEVGDLWVGNTSSELMRCKTERLTGNYSSSDWEKAVKYTDDTTANAVKKNLETNYSTTTQMNSAISQSADGIKTTVSQQITETKSYADTVANNAKNSANSSTEEKLKSYSTTSQMNSAISQSANSIKTEVSSTYATKSSVTSDIKSAVDGIEIGGRNIFIGSSKYNDWYATSQTETDYIEVGSNREITVSLERRVASGAINTTYCTIYQYDSNKNGAGFISTMAGAVTPIYLKDSITFKTDSSTAYIKLVFEPYTYYRHIKVEYGNKATDWTEAPEDVDENINSVRTVATQTADKFSWLVESGTSSSNFVLTDRTAELVAKIISLNGDVKVNGDMLIDGAVTAEKISVEDLVALGATIGGFTISSNSIVKGTWGADGSVMMCTGSTSSKSIGGSASISGWCFTAGSKFGVTKAGALYASSANIQGNFRTKNTDVDCVDVSGNGVSIYGSTGKITYLTETNMSNGTEGAALLARGNASCVLLGTMNESTNVVTPKLVINNGVNYGGRTENVYINGSTYVNGTFEAKTNVITPAIEIIASKPYIDFHFGNSTADYTSRIIENISGTLSVVGNFDIGKNLTIGDAVITRLNTHFVIQNKTSGGYIDLACGSAVRALNIAQNGYVAMHASSFVNQSSKRYKKHLGYMSDFEANKLMNLNVVNYDYINGEKGQYGLYAEDTEPIIPTCVYKNANDEADGIDYTKLIPYMIKKIQIQEREISNLKDLCTHLIGYAHMTNQVI